MARSTRQFLVIANPENRRIRLFQEGLAALKQPPAKVIPWMRVIEDPECLLELSAEPTCVRIDSMGENFEVDRALLNLGYEDAVAQRVSTLEPEEITSLKYDLGKIICPRQLHLGFERALRGLQRVLDERPQWLVLSPVASILELFDKRRTSRRYRAMGLPVPEPLDDIQDLESLHAAMDARGLRRVFVKLSCSSSASCLGIYTKMGERSEFFTTIEQAKTGWYNSLRVRRVTHPKAISVLLGFLFNEGSQIEAAVPKARLGGAPFDLRVVVIAGEPAFTVVRQSRHPITNLHLGGWRGDLQQIQARAPALLAEAWDTCSAVADAHRCFTVGVDIMLEAGWRGHRVLETNAFGDLLPGLTKDGLSVQAYQVKQALLQAETYLLGN